MSLQYQHSFFNQYNERFFFINATARDSFITKQLEKLTIDEVLHLHLKDLGYEGIFFLRKDRLYFFEPMMEQLLSLRNQNQSLQSNQNFREGRLRQRNQNQQDRYFCVAPSENSNEYFIGLMNALMLQNEHKLVFIVYDLETTLGLNNQEVFVRWKQQDANNKNICIFLYSKSIFDSSHQTIDFGNHQFLQIPPPNRDEIHSLFMFYRLNGFIDIDWNSYDHFIPAVVRFVRNGKNLDEKSLKAIEVKLLQQIEKIRKQDPSQKVNVDQKFFVDLIKQNLPAHSALVQFERRIGEEDPIDGLQSCKEWIQEIKNEASLQNQSFEFDLPSRLYPKVHHPNSPKIFTLCITGPKGVGKHATAKLLSQALNESSILSTGHLTKLSIEELRVHENPTGLIQEKIEESLGGTLLIDEPYLIAQGTPLMHIFMNKLILEIDKAQSEHYNQPLLIILTGHQVSLSELVDQSELKEHFKKKVHIDSFSATQMKNCFTIMIEDLGYHIEEIVSYSLDTFFKNWHLEVSSHQNFENAKSVETLIKKIILIKQKNDQSHKTIRQIDFPHELRDHFLESNKNVLDELNHYVGFSQIREILEGKANLMKLKMEQKKQQFIPPGHYVFLGNPGTGKTTIARIMGQLFQQIGILRRGHVVEVSRSDLVAGYVGQTAIQTRTKLEEALDGVLFIDEAYQLIQSNDDAFGREALETLLAFMENQRHRLCVILAGYPKQMKELLDSNPGFESRIGLDHYIEFKDYDPNDLFEIFKIMLKQRDLKGDADLERDIKKLLKKIYHLRGENFGNAREVRLLIDRLEQNQSSRILKKREQGYKIDDQLVIPNDISAEDRFLIDPYDDHLNHHLNELNHLIGLHRVKSNIQDKINIIKSQKGDDVSMTPPGHYVFLGNPGTGKTTVARKLGAIFKSLKLLKKGHVVEVGRSDLVAGFVGQTAIKTKNKLEEALDGVLFIDEAYQLQQNDQDAFGREAIETLLAFMENYRHRLSVILAGYTHEMNRLLEINPGLESRISSSGRIYFDDYEPKELLEIFKLQMNTNEFHTQSHTLKYEPILKDLLLVFQRMHQIKDEKFGNAREIRNFTNQLLTNYARRTKNKNISNREILVQDDIPKDYLRLIKQNPLEIDEIRLEIDQLIGLKKVKSMIDDKIIQIKVNLMQGNTKVINAGHYAFLGNPGTGKTTVARLWGKCLARLGILKHGHVIEVNRSHLISSYVGQSAQKTTEKFKEALDGVLLIDEAYQLFSHQDSLAKEVLDTLMILMENYRHKICVIFAGYTTETNQLLKSNVGFESRIPHDHRILFEDYQPEELYQILTDLIHAEHFSIGSKMQVDLKMICGKLYQYRDQNFGNAREMRNFFINIQNEYTKRMSKIDQSQQNQILTEEDIPESYLRLIRQKFNFSKQIENLKALEGLHRVKNTISNLIYLIQINQIENAESLVEAGHYTFLGNPGTGKTTIARMMGEIFKEMGLLKKGHVVEVNRSELVAAYVGQTAIKTTEKLKEALDGVFFIDEAYQLYQNRSDSFGIEALDTILAFMENNRHRVCVIFAGYHVEIESMLKQNVGFESRITKHLYFDDYTNEELVAIFKKEAIAQGFILEQNFEQHLLLKFKSISRDSYFGNARIARKLLNEVKIKRSERLIKTYTQEKNILNVIKTDQKTLRIVDL